MDTWLLLINNRVIIIKFQWQGDYMYVVTFFYMPPKCGSGYITGVRRFAGGDPIMNHANDPHHDVIFTPQFESFIHRHSDK